MKKILDTNWPLALFIIIFIAIFYKVFFFQLFPFPGDLLVSWFFPFKNGGWVGYSEWTTHKEFIAADVLRQLYPWRILAIDLIKSGQFPLWNPYAAAGTVLLANMQSAPFYPLNVLFFLFENRYAWVIYILVEPVMSFYFMYLFIRSLGLSRYAAFLCGLAFPFMGIMTMQFEWGTVVHAFSWLPLILYGIHEYFKTEKRKYLLLSTFALTCSLLAGYVQPTVYVLITTIVFFLYCMQNYSLKKKLIELKYLKELWFIVLSVGIAAIQLLPLYEAYSLSSRHSLKFELFYKFQFDYAHLVTLFAPDFFGNPAVGNFWGKDYAEFMLYTGIVVTFFAVTAIFYRSKILLVRWMIALGIIALLFALPTFLSQLLVQFNVTVLSTGVPARAIFITQFAIVILAGYGLDYFFTEKTKKFYPLIAFAGIYLILWMVVLASVYVWPETQLAQNSMIAKRNLILPSVIAIALTSLIFFRRFFVTYKVVFFIVIILLAAFEYQYFMYKYASFSPIRYLYPAHPLVSHLQKTVGANRIYGYDTAAIGTNLPTHWRLQYPQIYDSAYPKRYGELLSSTHNGKLDENLLRSDVEFKNSLPNEDSYPKQVVQNLLGTKYMLDKDDAASKEWQPRPDRFSPERFKLVWQDYKFKVYENKNALPRAAVFYATDTISTDAKIIEKLYNKNFAYQSTLILEEDPGLARTTTLQKITPATIVSYQPNQVDITLTSKGDGMLFLSDMYYPGWKAYVDNVDTKIYRADYAFRAVKVSDGEHRVSFKYQPESFRNGLVVTFLSLAVLCVLLFTFVFKNEKS